MNNINNTHTTNIDISTTTIKTQQYHSNTHTQLTDTQQQQHHFKHNEHNQTHKQTDTHTTNTQKQHNNDTHTPT